MTEPGAEKAPRKLSLIFAVLAVLGLGLVYAALIVVSSFGYHDWPKLFETHFAAMIGLPGAAAAAFVLVTLLRHVEGPIELEIASLKFKGASGPIIMWAVCFLAIAGAIKMLW